MNTISSLRVAARILALLFAVTVATWIVASATMSRQKSPDAMPYHPPKLETGSTAARNHETEQFFPSTKFSILQLPRDTQGNATDSEEALPTYTSGDSWLGRLSETNRAAVLDDYISSSKSGMFSDEIIYWLQKDTVLPEKTRQGVLKHHEKMQAVRGRSGTNSSQGVNPIQTPRRSDANPVR